MSQSTGAPSLFDDGQIGTGGNNNSQSQAKLQAINLIDLLHDGFYLIFLIRNQYVPADAQQFREKTLNLLNQFEQQAKKLQFSADDIHDAKYAFCALIDETIVTQQDPSYFNLQNAWLISPLQLSLFGSQLAGYRFFEILEQLRSRGKERLAALEVFHYCLLLGFQGKYRIESIESLNHLVSRVGDEIDYLKGKKVAFSPFSAIPDQIRNIIHREVPFFWILIFLLIFALLTFAGLRFMLNNQNDKALSNYQNVISAPQGVFVSISLFLFLSQPNSPESAAIESKSTEEQILNQDAAHSSDEQNQVAVSQDNDTDSMSRDGFEQPKDNELSNIFKPVPHKTVAANEQRVSPFDEQLTGEKKVQVVPQLQTSVAKTTQPKVQPAQQKTVGKPQQQVVQAKPVVESKAPAEPEPEVEPPKASVDIKITRSPFAVN